MPFGIFILDLKTAKWHYLFTTNEEGEWRGNCPLKLEPDGGSPNKYEHGKRKPLGAGSTRRQEKG